MSPPGPGGAWRRTGPTSPARGRNRSCPPAKSPPPGPCRSRRPTHATSRPRPAAPTEAVYLTGSHIWNNLHDGMGPGPDPGPERFDYDGYLALPRRRGTTSSGCGAGSSSAPRPPANVPLLHDAAALGANRDRASPRTGSRVRPRALRPGVLRPIPRAASSPPATRGIYVAVMLFDGWACTSARRPTTSRAIRSMRQQRQRDQRSARSTTCRSCPSTRASGDPGGLHRKVVDTVHDLPNVSGRSPTSRPAAGRWTRSSPSSWA